jgi:hypothetical protein
MRAFQRKFSQLRRQQQDQESATPAHAHSWSFIAPMSRQVPPSRVSVSPRLSRVPLYVVFRREVVASGRSARVQTRYGTVFVVTCAYGRNERKDFGNLNVSIALMEDMEKLRSRSVRKGIFAATRST